MNAIFQLKIPTIGRPSRPNQIAALPTPIMMFKDDQTDPRYVQWREQKERWELEHRLAYAKTGIKFQPNKQR